MTNKTHHTENKQAEEINLLEILVSILKHKYLILALSIIFTITGYVVGEKKQTKYVINFEVKKPSTLNFRVFDFLDLGIIEERPIKTVTLNDLKEEFFNTLYRDTGMNENFFSIINKTDKDKIFLQNDENNFEDLLKLITLEKSNFKDKSYKVTLTYPENIMGNIILEQYFSELIVQKQKSIRKQISTLLENELENIATEKKILSNKNKREINNSLFFFQQALNEAGSKLESNINTERVTINKYGTKIITTKLNSITAGPYGMTVAVLKAKIADLKARLEFVEKRQDFNEILTREESIIFKLKMLNKIEFNWMNLPLSVPKLSKKIVSSGKMTTAIQGLIFGLILSFLIIFFRYILKILRV